MMTNGKLEFRRTKKTTEKKMIKYQISKNEKKEYNFKSDEVKRNKYIKCKISLNSD